MPGRVLWLWKRYDVFLWKELASEAAEIFEQVWALCADSAIQQVMKRHGLAYVYYAWVVPEDEKLPCVDRYAVRCPAVSLAARVAVGGE